jgi:hypothetical protein
MSEPGGMMMHARSSLVHPIRYLGLGTRRRASYARPCSGIAHSVVGTARQTPQSHRRYTPGSSSRMLYVLSDRGHKQHPRPGLRPLGPQAANMSPAAYIMGKKGISLSCVRVNLEAARRRLCSRGEFDGFPGRRSLSTVVPAGRFATALSGRQEWAGPAHLESARTHHGPAGPHDDSCSAQAGPPESEPSPRPLGIHAAGQWEYRILCRGASSPRVRRRRDTGRKAAWKMHA